MAARPPKDVTVHMIGNAHIDPVWLWRAEEGFDEVRRTCASALERMDETPGFIFCRSSAATYAWLEANEPELFEQIHQRVAEGRWCIVGGWWVQPDCNVPCGESFVRQALYGTRYFIERFGANVRVGYNVDSFGHAAQLPQILKGCGLESYCFFRPGPHEKTLPAGLFAWQAPDGSQVVACRPPHHYNTGPDEIVERIAQAAEQAPLGLADVMCFYGVGDHGGGPTKANIESILAVAADPEAANAIFSTPDRFFQAVEPHRGELPVVADELQHHARGCYSVLREIKTRNHELEGLLLAAESFAALAHAAFGEPSRQAELAETWHTVLFHQFHDILAGTSIEEAYADAWPELDAARERAMTVLTTALESIGMHIDSVGQGEPLTLFNSLGLDRDEVIEVAPQDAVDGREPVVLDERMREVPSQWEDGHVVFPLHIRSLGYTTYHLDWELEPEARETSLAASRDALANNLVRLEFAGGRLARLIDKRSGAQLLAEPGASLVVLRDESDTWSHGVAAFRDEIGRFEPDAEPEVVETGPVRAAVRLRSRWGNSTAEQTFYLYHDSPRIDVFLFVDWHERHTMLKLALATALADATATWAVPYGAIVRPATGEEEPMQRWLDLSGSIDGAPAGLAVINDGVYGGDAQDAEMRLSLLRSPIYAFHDPRKPEPGVDYVYTDQGEHRFRFRLLPHAGSWHDAGVAREAQALNAPVYFRYENVQDGDVACTGSAVGVTPENVVLAAFKVAEDGEGLVVRIAETAGRPAEARIELHFADQFWIGGLRPFEIATIRFDLEREQAAAVNMLERPADSHEEPVR